MNTNTTNTNTTPNAPQFCPLCGENNQCALAADRNATQCWCFQIDIPRELLDKTSATDEMKRCICLQCVEQANQPARPETRLNNKGR